MPGFQVVGLGLCTLDILMRLSEMPTWEKSARMSQLGLDGGGPVGTAIVTAARLGVSTGYIGTRGNDEVADLKMKYLLKYGVDTSRVITRCEPESQIILCYVHEASGERLFSAAQKWSNAQLKVEELDRGYITSSDYLHLDGFHYKAAIQAANWMREAGKRVILDGGKTSGKVDPDMIELLKSVNILICGSGYGTALTGKRDLWEIGDDLLKMGPDIVVQTEGENGSYTSTADEHFHTPAYQVPVIDTTGAGDVFHGAYIVGLIKGWHLRKVATFASAVAAIKCTHLGGRAGIPTLQETLEFIDNHGCFSNSV